jgi:hypothetical protein
MRPAAWGAWRPRASSREARDGCPGQHAGRRRPLARGQRLVPARFWGRKPLGAGHADRDAPRPGGSCHRWTATDPDAADAPAVGAGDPHDGQQVPPPPPALDDRRLRTWRWAGPRGPVAWSRHVVPWSSTGWGAQGRGGASQGRRPCWRCARCRRATTMLAVLPGGFRPVRRGLALTLARLNTRSRPA